MSLNIPWPKLTGSRSCVFAGEGKSQMYVCDPLKHPKPPQHTSNVPKTPKIIVIMVQQYYCVDCVDYVVSTMIGSYTISVKNSLIVVTMFDFRTIKKTKLAVYFIVLCAYIY